MKKLFAAATVATLTLAACGGDSDISPDTLTKALVEQGIDEPAAECISNDLAEQLDTDDFNQVARAETEGDIPADLQDVVLSVTTDCILGGG